MADRSFHSLAGLIVYLLAAAGLPAQASPPSSGSEGLTVPIDIQPWQADNVLSLDKGEDAHVALLSTRGFHTPREVARQSLTFGRDGDEPSLRRCWWSAVDVNGDRLADLVCTFDIDVAGFLPGDTVGVLRGLTRDGVPFAGRDPVRTDPPAPVGLQTPDIGAAVAVEASAVCRRLVSHRVRARWTVSDFETPPRVTVTTVQFDGTTQRRRRAFGGTPGRGQSLFRLRAHEGGPLYVLLEARSSNGTATATTALALPPCDPEPPPAPGEGFTAPPTPPPEPPIGIPGGRLREVEVVHLGGSPDGPNAPRLVSAVGTGDSVQMTSWTLAGGTLQPTALKDSPVRVGHDVKLHALSPLVSPGLAVAPFVSGFIRDEILWLTTWQLAGDGTFVEVHTLGYGGDVAVRAFDIAHRPLSVSGHDTFQLVTPVLTDTADLRVVTWSVDAGTGQITGLQDSGPVPGEPTPITQLDIRRVDGSDEVDYVVGFRDTSGNLSTQLWEVFPMGAPFLRGGGSSGLDLRGNGTVEEFGLEFNVLPLAGNGFVTARRSAGDTKVSVWDYRRPGFEPLLAPYRIADESLDQDPGFGIDVGPLPMLTDGSHEKIQNGAVQNVRALLTDVLWEESFGPTAGEVVRVFPANEPTSVGIASVTKVMNLLVTVDALNAQNVDLDDPVTVSENAAGTGGSSMNLTEGETHTLRNLLYGMMIVSGNDAAVAIAEHVAGSEATFVDWMNLKAQVLGLSDTSYNQPAAGGYSTPEDQMNLFRTGWNDPLFQAFTSRREWMACGTLDGGDPVCRNLFKGTSDYPGLQGWKTGTLGFFDSSKPGVPLCTSCLVSQTRRADRTFIAMVQQSGSRWGDTRDLYDYGFTRLFTPDFRGDSGFSGGPVEDFALDNVTDRVAVTVALDASDEFQICTWSVLADTGSVQRGRCNGRSFVLAPSGRIPGRQRLDSARLSTLLVEGDYLTARGGQGSLLVLDLWRVAPKEP